MFVFLFNDSRIVSHLPFACNWQIRFLDSEPIVTRFPSNTSRTLDTRIPCNSAGLHLAPYMHVVRRVRWLGSSCTLKENVLSLILSIFVSGVHKLKEGHL